MGKFILAINACLATSITFKQIVHPIYHELICCETTESFLNYEYMTTIMGLGAE